MKNKKGFTLVELIITLALLSVLGTIIAVNMVGIYKKQQKSEKVRIESAIVSAAEAYIQVENIKGNCIKISDLSDSNYIKESEIKDYKDKYVEVTSNGNVTLAGKTSSCNTDKTKETYLITFIQNLSGETVSMPINKRVTKNTETDLRGDIPTTAGYRFAGWSATSSGKPLANQKMFVNKNMILYAKWAKRSFSIAFNTNGGSKIPSKTYSYKASTRKPTDPTKDHYTFQGWYTTSALNTTHVFGTMPAKDFTIYAKWEPVTYTITLDKNNGSGGTTTIYEKYNTRICSNASCTSTLSKVTVPTRQYYKFLGYYTASGTQLINASGNITTNFKNTTITENTTLIAKWERTEFDFTLVYEGADLTQTIPTTMKKTDTLTFTFTPKKGYASDKVSCNYATGAFNKSTNKLTVSNPIESDTNSVTCYVPYYKNVYVAFNSKNKSTITNLAAELKKNKIILNYNTDWKIADKNVTEYTYGSRSSVTNEKDYIIGGLLGDNFIYMKKQSGTNTFNELKVYNNLTKDIQTHKIGTKLDYPGYRINTYPQIYDNGIYYAEVNGDKNIDCGLPPHTSSGDADYYYSWILFDFYYYDKFDIDPQQENAGNDFYAFETSTQNSWCHKKYWRSAYSDNVMWYYLDHLFKGKSNYSPTSTQNYDTIRMSNDNKIFDFDSISVPNNIVNGFSEDNLKKNISTYKSLTDIKIVTDDSTNKPYYFQSEEVDSRGRPKDNYGDYGTIVTYLNSKKRYYDRITLKANDVTKGFISKPSSDTNQYYKNYYMVDLNNNAVISDEYKTGEIMGNNDYSNYTKLLIGYNNSKIIPSILNNNATQLDDYNAFLSKILNDTKE